MPELPDLTVYVEHIARRTVGATLDRVRLASPFLVRTVDPPIRAASGARVRGVSRMAKRIVVALEPDLYIVVHLMISGRFRWKERDAAIPKKVGLAAFDFSTGTLLLTEASSKKRASVHVVRGEAALGALDPGGIEPLEASALQYRDALRRENHTLKRSLTDPHLFSGIGNAYSDEILHRAKLSPARLSTQLSDAEIDRIREATRLVITKWIERLRADTGSAFPEKVTAFHSEMAVHGKYGQPCPVCGSRVMRIRYADNEANYCATCQTNGKLLADRGLSRLLGKDWPKTLEELEARKKA
jgi:formamidopyrimidine-DNA glycosylase